MRCGSVPEVLEDSVSGFIVENEEQAVAAVHRLPELRRANVRNAFDDRFNRSAVLTRFSPSTPIR
jgi:hypothetical protein